MADVVRFDSAGQLAVEVARRFLTVIGDVQAQGRIPQVVLTGGSIATTIYERIAEQAPGSTVDWSRVEFWWGDERYVAPDSPDRNAREARRALLDRVGSTRIHEMATPSSACSVDEGARAYEAEIRASGAGMFDLTLLSMGPDGHIASLFPGSRQLGTHDRVAVGISGSPKPPPERITLTLDALNRSERIWLFAVDSGPGGAKHQAFEQAMANDPVIPATQVHGAVETKWFVS